MPDVMNTAENNKSGQFRELGFYEMGWQNLKIQCLLLLPFVYVQQFGDTNSFWTP